MELEQLLLQPQTRIAIHSFMAKPAHALLLIGPAGTGKSTLARAIGAELLGLSGPEKLDYYPYFSHLVTQEGKQDIPIEEVRRVRHLMGLKVPGRKAVRRLIFIEEAHKLSQPAQNAILKTLEEPSPNTVFILTATSASSVLPTIASRAQQIVVRPVGMVAAKKYFSIYSGKEVESAWRLSRGDLGLLSSLLTGDASHPLKQAVDIAKDFLRQSPYERFLSLDSLGQDKHQLRLFLEALELTLSALHRSSLHAKRSIQAARLLAARQSTKRSMRVLSDNANPKLVLLDLVLNLKV